VKFVKLLLAVLLFSAAVYLLLLGGEERAEILSSLGIDLKPNVSLVICIQGLVVGLIVAVKAIWERPSVQVN